jgi:hypothetical protein
MLIAVWTGDYEVVDCPDCDSGVVFIRPSGHLFRWPGGPAAGRTSPDEYEKATPVRAAA